MANAADNFNRANSALGGSTASDGVSVWTVSGSINVSSNQAVFVSGNRGYINASAADVDVQATFPSGGGVGSQRIGLLLRHVDANNFICAYVRSTSAAFLISKFVAGVETNIQGLTALAFGAGDKLRISATGNQISLYHKPSASGEVLISGPHTVNDHLAATSHGIYSGGSVQPIDDFSITDLSAPVGDPYYYEQMQAVLCT